MNNPSEHPLEKLLQSVRQLHRGVRKALDKMARELTYVDTSEFTFEQLEVLRKARARLAAYEGNSVKLRRLKYKIKKSLLAPKEEWGNTFVRLAPKVQRFLMEQRDSHGRPLL